MRPFLRSLSVAHLALALACSSSNDAPAAKTDEAYAHDAASAMQASVAAHLDAWLAAAKDLQAAAPAPTGRGWDATADAHAIEATKLAWRRARVAYENVEGVIAPLFQESDVATDARFENFLQALKNQKDPDPFDATGMTGMHGIERILFANETPPSVITHEQGLVGYWPARWPADEHEAAEFKTLLCAKLVTDIGTVRDAWGPARLDLPTAYSGLLALMVEQREKVNKAETGEEESRYAQTTLSDLRANLAGTLEVYKAFRPWLQARPDASDASHDGPAIDAQVAAGFERLRAAYDAVQGEAIPQTPASWSAAAPTSEQLATPFGSIWAAVHNEADATRAGSVVEGMTRAGAVFGFGP